MWQNTVVSLGSERPLQGVPLLTARQAQDGHALEASGPTLPTTNKYWEGDPVLVSQKEHSRLADASNGNTAVPQGSESALPGVPLTTTRPEQNRHAREASGNLSGAESQEERRLLLDDFSRQPVPIYRPIVNFPNHVPAGPPHLTDEAIPKVAVPVEALYICHCGVAGQDFKAWVPTHNVRGLPNNPLQHESAKPTSSANATTLLNTRPKTTRSARSRGSKHMAQMQSLATPPCLIRARPTCNDGQVRFLAQPHRSPSKKPMPRTVCFWGAQSRRQTNEFRGQRARLMRRTKPSTSNNSAWG